jgi:flagellin-like protein
MAKGLSPLIAVVLLIAITVSIVAIMSTWVTTLTKSETGTITNKTGSSTACIDSNLAITNVYMDAAGNVSRIVVRNSGHADDTIASASLMNKDGAEAPNLSSFPISFPQGSIKTIMFNVTNFNLTNETTVCQDFSRAIVSTACGTYDTFTGTPDCS